MWLDISENYLTLLRKAPRYASLHFLQIVYTIQLVLILPPFSVSIPKAKLAGKSYVRQLPREYARHYNAKNDQVLCKICSCGFDYSPSNGNYRVNKHVESEKHKSETEASDHVFNSPPGTPYCEFPPPNTKAHFVLE